MALSLLQMLILAEKAGRWRPDAGKEVQYDESFR